jgi:hypothetical protein
MPHKKMLPPSPDKLGESEHDRFKRFAKALLAVPKSEITLFEERVCHEER